jgi:hypothetical protein
VLDYEENTFLSISIMCILFLSACSGSEPNSYDKETSSGTTIDTVNEKETPARLQMHQASPWISFLSNMQLEAL